MPDRLMAGLQILVLTMLVRIQLGQQANPLSLAERVFCFFRRAKPRLSEQEKTKKPIFREAKRVCLGINFYQDQRGSRRRNELILNQTCLTKEEKTKNE